MHYGENRRDCRLLRYSESSKDEQDPQVVNKYVFPLVREAALQVEKDSGVISCDIIQDYPIVQEGRNRFMIMNSELTTFVN